MTGRLWVNILPLAPKLLCERCIHAGPLTGTVLGVRTYASTSILEATVARPTSQSSSIQTKEIITVLRSDISDKRAVDITMPTSRRTLAFVINDEGAVYKCSAPQGDKLVSVR